MDILIAVNVKRVSFAIFGMCLWVVPLLLQAQNTCTGTQGENAVYAYCNSGGLGTVGTSAFADATVFAGSAHPNICTILNYVLSPSSGVLPSTGGVIDARGLPNTSTSMTCTGTPWSGISNPLPSTILLPAGVIVIPSPWILPSNTRLIGEGDSVGSGTTIRVNGSFSAPGPMIQFGSSSACCTGISVENLTLDGQGTSTNGIVNQYATYLSYVDHVTLYQIRGTGLLVSGSANNSGPYSNITFDTGGYSGTTSTVCVQIEGLTGTQGIRGLSCTSESNDAPAAVLLDSSNNSLRDIRIVGFYDGVLIGANATAQSNVLWNVFGDTTPMSLTPIYVIHISPSNVTNLAIKGISSIGGFGSYTLFDELTSTKLSDAYVGMYAIGESVSGGYSRYTTSPNAATWAVGSSAPSGGAGSCSQGSIYSCINPSAPGMCNSGSTLTAVWACLSSGWVGVK
jgi:hypothetical protein